MYIHMNDEERYMAPPWSPQAVKWLAAMPTLQVYFVRLLVPFGLGVLPSCQFELAMVLHKYS